MPKVVLLTWLVERAGSRATYRVGWESRK